jgi:hypothetical protein
VPRAAVQFVTPKRRMATSGAVSSGQGDLEPDGQAVLSVCRILRKHNNRRSMVRPRLAIEGHIDVGLRPAVAT